MEFARDLHRDWSSGSSHTEGMVEADGQSIEIVTVHSSKGLEWPVVIPINRASMPRRAEQFVYRRGDESLHWALGQVTPPSLEDAVQGENVEKRNENLRLLYVACTRAMELLIIPDFTWSNDASWVKQLDFKLERVPELDVSHLTRRTVTVVPAVENKQTEQVFAEEQTRLNSAFHRIHWIRPSDSDPDVIPVQLHMSLADEEPLQALPIEGSRIRGIVLHKLMEELLTTELPAILEDTTARAKVLLDQLASTAASGSSHDPKELATTAVRTLMLKDLNPFRDRLLPEVPVYGTASESMDKLIGGRADAVGWSEDGTKVAFDWKSDVAPDDGQRAAHAQQLAQYLHVIRAKRGAVVYMTSGRVHWVTAPVT
jgi:CRISPR-associated exonuclease Cas4